MRFGRDHGAGAAGGGWTAVVPAAGRIDIAHVSRSGDGPPRVLVWESFAAEAMDAAVVRRLRGRIRGRCTTLLGYGQYQMLQTEAPSVPPEEMANALRWRVKDMVSFPVEQAGIDFVPIPAEATPGRPPQVHVVVASHAVLTPLVRMFQAAGVRLDAIDIPELAQRNLGVPFEAENRALAFLSFDEQGGRLTFNYAGEICVSRHIDVTSTALARSSDDVGGLFERVLLDVQRSLDNFDRNYSAVTLSRVLVAPTPGAPGFTDYLKNNLYQKVEALDMSAGLDLGAVPALAEPAVQAQALLAIGAALREEVGT